MKDQVVITITKADFGLWSEIQVECPDYLDQRLVADYAQDVAIALDNHDPHEGDDE